MTRLKLQRADQRFDNIEYRSAGALKLRPFTNEFRLIDVETPHRPNWYRDGQRTLRQWDRVRVRAAHTFRSLFYPR